MKSRTFGTLAAILLVAAPTSTKEAVQDDIKQLQGAWVGVSGESNGKKFSAEQMKKVRLEIKDRVWILDEGRLRARILLDPTRKPKTVNLTYFLPKAFRGKTRLGIYVLQGDRLKVCYSTRADGKNRPKDFTTSQDSGRFLHIYKKKP